MERIASLQRDDRDTDFSPDRFRWPFISSIAIVHDYLQGDWRCAIDTSMMPRLEGSTQGYAVGNLWEENVVGTPLILL
jgi:hypothetical protein